MSNSEKKRIRILMKKYLDESCSAEERDELIERIKTTYGPEEVDVMLKEVWEGTDRSEILEELTWDRLVEASTAKQRSTMKAVWLKVWRWSAAAAIVIGVYFAVDWWNVEMDMMVYETEYGETQEIVLDDGTKVSLNAHSKLIWDKEWEEKKVRKVQLKGEAFFDVSHIDMEGEKEPGKRIPFEVETSDLTINVLGTAFNASQRRGKTEVYLERGVVALELNEGNALSLDDVQKDLKSGEGVSYREDSKRNDSVRVVRMSPGDLVSFSSDGNTLIQKRIETIKEHSAWREGTLSYRDVEFRVMLQNLEDIYGKSFQVDDQELLNKRVNFGVPFEKWETVTEMMEMMLKIEITEITEDTIGIKKRTVN